MNYHLKQFSSQGKPGLFYGYRIVALCYITSMIVWGTYNSFGVFFDSLLNEFHWSRAITAGAFSFCTVLSGIAAIPFSRITDKFGPRMVMTVCSLLLGGGYILMSQITTIWHFYVVYGVIIGVGTSGFWVPVLSTVSRWFSKKRGLMVGIVLTGSGAGTLIFPPIANRLISNFQWRISIAIIGVITIVIGIILSQFIKRDPYQIGLSPDGNTENHNLELSQSQYSYSLKEALSIPQFWIAIFIFLCCGFYGYTILVHIVSHALYLGISSVLAANLLTVIGGISILGGLCTGVLVDKIGVKISLIIFVSIAIVALIWLIFSQQSWQLYLFAIIFGFTYGSIGVSETITSVWLFGLKANASILSIIDLGLTIGAAIGPLIAGYIFDVNNNYRIAFILTSCISIIVLILTIFIKPPIKSVSSIIK